MNQQALDFTARPPPVPAMQDAASAIHQQFLEFHRQNPEVYDELRRLALQLRQAGRKRYGLKGLFEVLRWQRALSTSGDAFKLNNNYTAYYARLLMAHEPALVGFFETREQADG